MEGRGHTAHLGDNLTLSLSLPQRWMSVPGQTTVGVSNAV